MRFMICELRLMGAVALLGAAMLLSSASLVHAQAPAKKDGQTKARTVPRKAAPAPAGPKHTIDLATALRLAGAQNLDVQLARERVREAQALHEQARLRFFPWISPSVGYRRHDGNLQDIVGDVFDASKQQYTIGAGLNLQLDLGDALYQSLAARQLARAAEEGAQARRQDTVAAAAAGYLDLARAHAVTGVAAEALRLAQEYAGQVQRAVETGIAFKGDAFRAQVQVEKNHIALRRAQEQQRLAAARLAQTLRLDPTVELIPDEAELAPLTFSEKDIALDSLVVRALAARPELRQFAALQAAARAQQDGARTGPWIPQLGAQALYGGLGGGRNGSTGNFDDTFDFLFGASWRIGPGGIGDRARLRAADARARQSELELEKTRDAVTRQVVEAHTRLHSLADQLALARRALAAAEESFILARERREFGVGAVLETLQAEQELTRAREDYLGAVAEFNRAQFDLRRAIGAE